MCETFTAPSWLTAEEEDDAAAAKVLRALDDDDVDEGLAVSLRAEYAHAVDKHKRIFWFVCLWGKKDVRIELLKRKDECGYHLTYSLH
jgi:RPA family protein